MTCELLVLCNAEQIIAGRLTLLGGKVAPQAEPGYELLMKRVMKDVLVVNGRQVTSASAPRAWLSALPKKYTGTYLRAKLTGVI